MIKQSIQLTDYLSSNKTKIKIIDIGIRLYCVVLILFKILIVLLYRSMKNVVEYVSRIIILLD